MCGPPLLDGALETTLQPLVPLIEHDAEEHGHGEPEDDGEPGRNDVPENRKVHQHPVDPGDPDAMVVGQQLWAHGAPEAQQGNRREDPDEGARTEQHHRTDQQEEERYADVERDLARTWRP